MNSPSDELLAECRLIENEGLRLYDREMYRESLLLFVKAVELWDELALKAGDSTRASAYIDRAEQAIRRMAGTCDRIADRWGRQFGKGFSKRRRFHS